MATGYSGIQTRSSDENDAFQGFRERYCLFMPGGWSISWDSYSLNTSDRAVLLRRVCMYVILGTRLLLSIRATVFRAWGFELASFIIGIILGVLCLFWAAWCLAVISEAQGRRMVFGINFNRRHFDVFLLCIAIIHIIVLLALPTFQVRSLWLLSWVLLYGVAWIRTWPAEPEITV
ncbi:hypothetical protein CKAH01_18114 [Colletotrichum kahawae]|uniref:Uncharacterized protein n=1 Tax=Colletotrichum kahawae TaxID=34407 RepID=A0AAD9Y9K2_COLKA|nr:hypothetical protein CKAH01_18114 [Colletotrichum kahawae]